MRLGHLHKFLTVAFTLPGFAATLAAQDSGTPQLKAYAEFALARASFIGNDISRVHPGFGFDIAAAVTSQPPLIFAVGVQYTRHSTDSTPEPLGMTQVYVEPRIQLIQKGKVIPIISVRLGYLRATQTQTLIDDTGGSVTGETTQTGALFGAGAGLLYKSSPHVRSFVNVAWQHFSLGNLDFDFSKVAGSSLKAASVLIRAGISLDFSISPD